MTPETLTILMFLGIFIGVFIGFPIAFTLGGLGLIFGLIGWGPSVYQLFAHRSYGLMTEYTYAALPLFIFMGVMLEKAGIAELAFDTMYKWLGGLKGGLALATIVLSTIFAACTGIVGASVSTMGLIALPSMVNRGYDKSLATGVVGAGGTLGILIPPSIMLILYGPMAGVSVVELFAGAFIPGLLLAVLYFLYVFVRCQLNPEMGPAIPLEYREKPNLIADLKTFFPFIFLILSVLGAIFFGITAPTEAAGIGALGSIVVAVLYRRLTIKTLRDACMTTVKISSMILFVALGATLFTAVFFSIGGGRVITSFITSLGLSGYGVLAVVLFIVFLLGMFIDWVGILLIMTPIFVPVLKMYGFNPLWTGMLIIVMLQSSFLTPPFAYALFYIKGIAPKGVTLNDIYKGVIPFVILQLVGLTLCIIFPGIITWLPSILMNR